MVESKNMNNHRRVLFLVLVVCLGPFVIALILYTNLGWMSGNSAYGRLIEPLILTKRSEFQGLDDFSKSNIHEIRGHWVFIHFVPGSGCGEQCSEALEKTKKIRLMLNKDLMRVRRMAIILGELDTQSVQSLWLSHIYLLRVRASRRILEIARSVVGSGSLDGVVLVMDPIGNLMMWYPSEFEPYEVKKDLKRLLKVSQIG